ncbi:MAG: formate--tetrahydrofolate ligase, partial [Malacoplasma sp.]|nr:formate--tetrahydrofolate ligase [Malacoplasma sp.]
TWQYGPSKNLNLVKLIERNISKNYKINFSYDLKDNPILKMEKIAKTIYGAEGINLSEKAKSKLETYKNQVKDYYICFAKTPFSLSSNPNLLGRPKNFYIDVEDFEINSAVKFLIPITSKIFMMPGLSREPNAKRIKYNAKK